MYKYHDYAREVFIDEIAGGIEPGTRLSVRTVGRLISTNLKYEEMCLAMGESAVLISLKQLKIENLGEIDTNSKSTCRVGGVDLDENALYEVFGQLEWKKMTLNEQKSEVSGKEDASSLMPVIIASTIRCREGLNEALYEQAILARRTHHSIIAKKTEDLLTKIIAYDHTDVVDQDDSDN